MSTEDTPRGPTPPEEITDAVLLDAANLRLQAERLHQREQQATPEIFGHAGVAASMQTFLGEASAYLSQRADHLDQITRAALAEHRDPHSPGEDGDE
ncbi:hypothetical protein FHX42_005233 [Saccharopolyspora lacisalsi]|uniref:Uncharacterized protein n=1 Tax=Halosaccharopolyspora lacisalsi TaxID=1000566 RepID=A0A839E5C5_9PSEU|nr:hypothetical protein [Halosaccharopolyspora lacisalsi]MBA8827826.1 hypothetical protein [Halosaccharopolyspora lacisalsi]